MTKWITPEYVRQSPSGKTGLWEIRSVADRELLGAVRWHGPWRQYVFYPEWSTLWNPDCLDEVSAFLRDVTTKQRNGQA